MTITPVETKRQLLERLREVEDVGILRRAFVRSLEIIGEASKKLPENFREAHEEIEWRSIAGMRDTCPR